MLAGFPLWKLQKPTICRAIDTVDFQSGNPLHVYFNFGALFYITGECKCNTADNGVLSLDTPGTVSGKSTQES